MNRLEVRKMALTWLGVCVLACVSSSQQILPDGMVFHHPLLIQNGDLFASLGITSFSMCQEQLLISMLDQRGKRIYYTYINETEKWFLIGGDWGEVGTEVWWTKGVEERRTHSLFQRQ